MQGHAEVRRHAWVRRQACRGKEAGMQGSGAGMQGPMQEKPKGSFWGFRKNPYRVWRHHCSTPSHLIGFDLTDQGLI